MGLVSELRRRNVLRMALLYAVAAWLIMQVADVIIELANLPEWLGPAILLLLAVGFPIAIILSWFYELTPEGISLEKDLLSTESTRQLSGRRLDLIVISLLFAAVVLFAYDKWWPRDLPGRSIAVLPFINMSAGPEQEYFSDGLSEELLNLLAKIPELRVVARTSAFAFKGENLEIPEIARRLNVDHVLEGSVRSSGERLRISVQLIKADDGYRLWSQIYDREVGDIFSTQEEIAASVVKQLKITLLGEVPKVAATDPEAYSAYLQARHLDRQNTPYSMEKAVELYQQALASDPGHAAAWAGLAGVYGRQAGNGLRPVDEGFALAREAAQQALVIDRDYAPALAILGRVSMNHDSDLMSAARYFERALSLEPANPDIIRHATVLASSLGRQDQSIAFDEYLVARDPVNPAGHAILGTSYISAGRLNEAVTSFRTALMLSSGYVGGHYLAGVALMLNGENEAALGEMVEELDELWRLTGLSMVHHNLGSTEESDAALAALIEKYEREAAFNIAHVFAFRGEADRAFEWLDKAVVYNDPGLPEINSNILFAHLHEDPRWLPFLARIGKSPEQLAAVDFDVALPQ